MSAAFTIEYDNRVVPVVPNWDISVEGKKEAIQNFMQKWASRVRNAHRCRDVDRIRLLGMEMAGDSIASIKAYFILRNPATVGHFIPITIELAPDVIAVLPVVRPKMPAGSPPQLFLLLPIRPRPAAGDWAHPEPLTTAASAAHDEEAILAGEAADTLKQLLGVVIRERDMHRVGPAEGWSLRPSSSERVVGYYALLEPTPAEYEEWHAKLAAEGDRAAFKLFRFAAEMAMDDLVLQLLCDRAAAQLLRA